jgi:nitrate reductase delta subunit
MVTVSDRPTDKRIWGLFAELLEYPLESPVEMLRECRTLTGALSPDAEIRLAEFQAFAEEATLGRLQEEYTRAFDMDESHSLGVGYHLLGESYKRSALLLEFKERYRAHGIEVAGELADHLPVILRFLAVCDDQDLTNEIVAEAMWPMLEMMARKDQKSEDAAEDEDRPPAVARPYLELLAALLVVVRASPMGDGQPLALADAVGWSTT